MANSTQTSPGKGRGRNLSIDDYNVYDDAKTYYTTEDRHHNYRAGARTRTYSQVSFFQPDCYACRTSTDSATYRTACSSSLNVWA